MTLDEFNSLDIDAARGHLRPCVDIDRWIDAVVEARPYSNVEDVMGVAATAADPWTEAEIDGALAHHPRIGEKARGTSEEASFSRSEQADVDVTVDSVAAELAAGNREYEQKFDRVFLIRAAGRSASEILAALRERLMHSHQEEVPVVAQQLREIAVLRLRGVLNS